MIFNKKRRVIKIVINSLILFTAIFSFIYIQALYLIPNELYIISGKEYKYNFKIPAFVGIVSERKSDIKVNGSLVNNKETTVNLLNQFTINSVNSNKDKIEMKMKFFGMIPLKTMLIEVVNEKKVIPCGNSIGVKIHTEGALVVGKTKLIGFDGKTYEPYKNSNIQIGDYIIEINGTKIKNIINVTYVMNNINTKVITLKILRKKAIIDTVIEPCRDKSGKYKMGLWLRDSTAGIGTMTFYDKDNEVFGALGHGVTDVDSGSLMTIDNGEILKASIIGIRKGNRGSPGELKGLIMEDKGKGEILSNTEYGIFGYANKQQKLIPDNKPISIALRNEIKEGPAQIITNINGTNLNVYNINIIKVFKNSNSFKNMIIKVTDERLLNYTGGIVQGMSGSPIIQDGKLIGAVTHVLVNDPTKGYGIFIEWMLKKAEKIKYSEKIRNAS